MYTTLTAKKKHGKFRNVPHRTAFVIQYNTFSNTALCKKILILRRTFFKICGPFPFQQFDQESG